MSSGLFTEIVANLIRLENTDFRIGPSDEEELMEIINQYIDAEIACGNIVKKSQYDFRCEGWVKKLNSSLENSQLRLEASSGADPRIYAKVKGQGCYFIIYLDNKPIKTGILTWSLMTVILFDYHTGK